MEWLSSKVMGAPSLDIFLKKLGELFVQNSIGCPPGAIGWIRRLQSPFPTVLFCILFFRASKRSQCTGFPANIEEEELHLKYSLPKDFAQFWEDLKCVWMNWLYSGNMSIPKWIWVKQSILYEEIGPIEINFVKKR